MFEAEHEIYGDAIRALAKDFLDRVVALLDSHETN